MRIFYLFAAFVATLFVGCSGADSQSEEHASELIFSSTVITVGAEGGPAEVLFFETSAGSGLTIEATTTSEWISNITVEDRIKFDVEANDTPAQRLAIIDVVYGTNIYNLAVQQEGITEETETKIMIPQRKVEVAATGGTFDLFYSVSGSIASVIPEVSASADWITIDSVDASKVVFTVDKNVASAERKASITLSCDDVSAKTTVVQSGSTDDVVLLADTTTPHVGEPVTFTVVYGSEDITSKSGIYDYYTHKEISNPMTFDEVGERALYAEYEGVRSKVLSVNVISASAPDFPADSDPESYDFKYRMLLIEHTGTDCPYCPYMMESLKIVEENPSYNDCFNLAIAHSFNSSDPATSSVAYTVRYYYQKTLEVLTGFPTLTFNYQYPDSAGSNISYIYRHLDTLKKEKQSAAVAVAAKIDGDKIIVSASLKSKEARHYKFNIFLLEDNIYGSQSNAYESWMNIHNNAIRDSYSVLSNSDITGSDWGYISAESTSSKVFEMAIPNTVIRRSELKVLVVIAAQDSQYNNKYEVVNTTMCKLGASVPFEYVD